MPSDRYTENDHIRQKDTNSVVGAERVEGVRSTYEETTVLAKQDLDEVTALSLQEKTQREKKGRRSRGEEISAGGL